MTAKQATVFRIAIEEGSVLIWTQGSVCDFCQSKEPNFPIASLLKRTSTSSLQTLPSVFHNTYCSRGRLQARGKFGICMFLHEGF
ncbi:hypothetical protein RHMOL_Rhmol07G0165700 [Rhododendron molle]|uniref:Uncharacterized protein n=1 Tax=Rhododendron molle TaxID=49168 RepID=A0ACC0N152_RHOML|nr:hypothetical protein RHMOL_Rhmol07G0165700 [Rhododendron molle]